MLVKPCILLNKIFSTSRCIACVLSGCGWMESAEVLVVGGGAPQNTQKDDFLYLVAVKISSVASASSGRPEKSERDSGRGGLFGTCLYQDRQGQKISWMIAESKLGILVEGILEKYMGKDTIRETP